MIDSIDCLRCHTAMEQGYILDRGYGEWKEVKWSPGAAQHHWWGIEKPKRAVPVITMRCPKCGALESYARPA